MTERGGGSDLDDLARHVERLRSRGAGIALDDLAAGTAEFATLAALVGYARYLGMATCAEGVEDAADLAHLVGLGVTHAQGFLLARPRSSWQGDDSGPPKPRRGLAAIASPDRR